MNGTRQLRVRGERRGEARVFTLRATWAGANWAARAEGSERWHRSGSGERALRLAAELAPDEPTPRWIREAVYAASRPLVLRRGETRRAA